MPGAKASRQSSAHFSLLQFTIPPGISSPLSVQTDPGAVCTVHAEGETDPKRSLRMYADPEGVIRFHVQPDAESEEVGKLVIESERGGKVSHRSLHLRSNHTPTEKMPAPLPERALAFRNAGRALQPLSVDEALRLTDEEALARGYPLRPNPEEVPKTFHAWLRAVSTPMVAVEPHLISNPNVSHGKNLQHGPSNSKNWSGFELDRSFMFVGPRPDGVRFSAAYDWVAGEWNVPSVTAEPGGSDFSALWVGLDGDGLADLVQAGTEQNAVNTSLGAFGSATLATYYAWTEFLPQQPLEQVISSFVVSPGDQVFTEVWMGNAGSSPVLSGAFGIFMMMNLSTGVSTYIYTPVGSTQVSGAEAVWVVERPTVGAGLPDLSNYGSVVLSSAAARRVNSAAHQGYVSYQGARNKQLTMLNGANVLSTVTPIDASSMRFNWKLFK